MEHCPRLSFPEPSLRLVRQGSKVMVWDSLRKKYLVLTPEEWVRQHVLYFLQQHRGYPRECLAAESGFKWGERQRRTDILIYRKGTPKMLVECKAPQVTLSQAAVDQVLQYNRHYQLPWILVTNGLQWLMLSLHRPGEPPEKVMDIPPFASL